MMLCMGYIFGSRAHIASGSEVYCEGACLTKPI